MEWLERLNECILYIEDNLQDDIDYEELGKIACCSSYHFQRMFSYMVNMPLSEYIRKRRMSLAAVDLQSGNEKIIDIALKYGYNSPTAFNRAFQSVHGFPPSYIKKNCIPVKAFPPVKFHLTIKGAEEMNYRIVKKDAFRVIGISSPIEKEIEKNFKIVPQMWDKAHSEGIISKLVNFIGDEPQGILGICDCERDKEWRYYIGVSSSQKCEEFEEYIIPSAIWAIFSGSGKIQYIQELEQRIFTEWLPSSGYEYGNAPDIEVYLNADPENAEFEVWIPVVKK